MSPAVLGYLNTALSVLPLLITAGQDVTAWINDLRSTVNSGKDPTPDQWTALDARMQSALQALSDASKPAK